MPKALSEPWDMTTEITIFIQALNDHVDYCHLLEMTDINDDSKAVVFVANMYASELFTDTEMYNWELELDQSWAAAQEKFIALYKKKRVRNQNWANWCSGFDSANSVAEQTAASNHFSQSSSPHNNNTNFPDLVITAATGMSTMEQQTMADYAKQFDARLERKEQEFRSSR